MHAAMKILSALFFLMIVIVENGFTQGISILRSADSLYFSKSWKEAKTEYKKFLSDTSTNAVVWNRMGYCNQNLGLYSEAISDYNKSLANHPVPIVKSSVESRMAMVYSLLNKTSEAEDWLIKATLTGYNSLNDLDSLDAFSNLRASANFPEIRQHVYEIIYPCSINPRNHDFDFWIGDWNCYRTGSKILSGYSHVESMAGGCAILENFLSTQAYSGKSFNFVDTATGKWVQDWIGSGGPGDRQHFYNGEYRDSIMHFVYEKTNTNGEKVKGNFIFYFINKNTVRQYQDVMNADGKTVSVVYDLTYLRKN
jgi:tetratricopeptide (TPR) repeat protein